MAKKKLTRDPKQPCIHCNRCRPEVKFWGSRPTCVECAKKRWYSPQIALDPKLSPNWKFIQPFFASGLVQFPRTKSPT